jgi:hypothetical protein
MSIAAAKGYSRDPRLVRHVGHCIGRHYTYVDGTAYQSPATMGSFKFKFSERKETPQPRCRRQGAHPRINDHLGFRSGPTHVLRISTLKRPSQRPHGKRSVPNKPAYPRSCVFTVKEMIKSTDLHVMMMLSSQETDKPFHPRVGYCLQHAGACVVLRIMSPMIRG